jgi:membrane-associated protease RseP (regulator of RpoE activity)
MFATALNLLPGGQLDGGHIIFAVAPRWHRFLSQLLVAALLVCGVLYWQGWLIWGFFLLFFALRHPPVPLHPGIDRKRKWLAAFALLMFVLTFAVTPLGEKSLDQTIRDAHGAATSN